MMLRLLCLVGLMLSLYALYVERMSRTDPGFTSLCDITSWVSCSKVFSSPEGHIFFGLPNALFGAIFYVSVVIGSSVPFSRYLVFRQLVFLAAAFAAVFSVYLAYVLYRMRDVCVLCMTTWVVNFLLLFVTHRRVATFGAVADSRKKRS